MSETRADGAVPSVGDLKQVPLTRLLEEAHHRRLTGALHFEAGAKKKTVFFEEGMVIGAQSNLLSERLGQVLVRMGKIDAAACGDTLSLQRSRGESLGNIAIDLGLVAEEDLQDGLRRQVEERIGELFRWQEGGYAFTAVDPRRAKVAVIRISAAEAVLTGARLGLDVARLKALLAPFARKVIVLCSTTTSRLGDVRLEAREEALLRTIDGRTTLAGTVRGAGPDGRLILALLYGALTIGIVAVRDAPEAPAGELAGAGDVHRGILDRAWICTATDHYAVLGLGPSSGAAEVRERYLELAKTVHPDRLALGAPEELQSLAEAVFARIAEAHSVLSNPASRATWDRERQGRDTFARKAEEAERAVQAEMQYQKGLVYLRKRSLRDAVEAFRWAVTLCPDEGEYLAYHGWALHRAAIADGQPSPPDAREELDRAIALRPKMEQAHVFLGNLRKAQGDIPGAEASYRRALEILPGCTEAGQELRVIEMRREKGRG